jgi:hypothetical protein
VISKKGGMIMKHQEITLKRLMAVLCIFLILLYASIAFIPHSHDRLSSECEVCSFVANSHDVLGFMVLACAITLLNELYFIIVNTHHHLFSGRDGTPVGLKVKLSD